MREGTDRRWVLEGVSGRTGRHVALRACGRWKRRARKVVRSGGDHCRGNGGRGAKLDGGVINLLEATSVSLLQSDDMGTTKSNVKYID